MPAEKKKQPPFVELHDVAAGLPALTVAGRLYVASERTPARRVVCATLRADANLVVAATLDKTVLVLRRRARDAPFEQQAAHKIPKRATALALAPCGQHVLLADAFGDVYKLALDACTDVCTDAGGDAARALGHFSTVTAIAFARNGASVATGDRDARVRVSRWPLSHVVEAFALGHSGPISSVCAAGDAWVSAATDGSVRLWRADGACAASLAVKPDNDDDDDDDEDAAAAEADVVVVGLRVCGDGDAAVFATAGGKALRCVYGLAAGRLCDGGVLAAFDGTVSGVCARGDRVWVSVGERAETVRLEVGKGDSGKGLVVTERVVEAIDVVAEEEGSAEKGEKRKEGEDGDDGGADGQFAWLARQRKKEMVEGWKGKKRTHVHV